MAREFSTSPTGDSTPVGLGALINGDAYITVAFHVPAGHSREFILNTETMTCAMCAHNVSNYEAMIVVGVVVPDSENPHWKDQPELAVVHITCWNARYERLHVF